MSARMILRNERGATLPLAIMVIALLTLGAVVGLNRVSSERRNVGSIQAEAEAYSVAQAGMERYLATVSAQPAASLDTTITGLPGNGTAAISVRRLRAAGTLPALYVVRSVATHAGAVRYGPTDPTPQRSVTQFATWQASWTPPSGWTAIGGLSKSGTSGILTGNDACGQAPPVAGVTVPVDPGYMQSGGGTSVPTGIPPINYRGANSQQMSDLIPIDWAGILAQTAITPDLVISNVQQWPPASFFTNWPILMVTNGTGDGAEIQLDAGIKNPPVNGRGILIVRGNLRFGGQYQWDGIILVGGAIRSSGDQTISGAVISGLNTKIGLPPPTSDMGSGNKTFQYDSCKVQNAMAKLAGFNLVSRTWGDTWPTW